MIARSLAHDLRGVIAAAASNVEFARAQKVSADVAAALHETANELRVASDVIALLGAHTDRVVEIDLRAAVLAHREESAIAIDATEPTFVVSAPCSAFALLGKHLAAIAPRGRLHMDADGCTLEPVDGEPTMAVLSAANLDGVLSQRTLVLRRKAAD